MPNNGNYPNFGGFSQTFGVNTKILGFYTLGTHYSWGYPNFESLPKMCYLDEAWICALRLRFVVLLRCGRLPSASQLGWLGALRHGTNIGQTQLHLSLLSRSSLPVIPPLVLLGKLLWIPCYLMSGVLQ